ncbi:MAG: hypothetical protein GY801_07060 [bacterium]|nr:hypothetical protein [bacterium]
MLYPLEVQKRVIGVLAFGSRQQPFELTDAEITKTQQYVLHIATAINNARLHAELSTTKIQLAETERIVALTDRLQEKEKEYSTLVEHINLGVYRNSGGVHGKFLGSSTLAMEICLALLQVFIMASCAHSCCHVFIKSYKSPC